jgi:hypothetical protein
MIPATAGGKLIQVAEGGYAEVVLSTDPKHRTRSAGLLGDYLKRTKLIPQFAAGGFSDFSDLNDLSRVNIDKRDFSRNQTTNVQPAPQNKNITLSLDLREDRPRRRGYTQPRDKHSAVQDWIRKIQREVNR